MMLCPVLLITSITTQVEGYMNMNYETPSERILKPTATHMKIKSYIPESGSTTINVDESLELWCNVDRNWEWCNFSHKPSAKFCDFFGKKTGLFEGNVTVNDCSSFEGRFEYLGDYDNFKCGIRVHNIVPEDSGLWMCYLRAREGIQIAGMAFQVTVTTEDGIDVASVVVGSVVGVVIITLILCVVFLKIFKKSSKKVCKDGFKMFKKENVTQVSEDKENS